MKKKILILTGEFGQGHLTAAQALKEAFEEIGKDKCEIEIVDLVTTFRSILTKTMSKAYKHMVRFMPKFYKIFYVQADNKIVMKLLNEFSKPFLRKKCAEILQEINPDLVISTYPLWNYFVQNIWKQASKKTYFATVITDTLYSEKGSGGWLFARNDDVYFVPNEDTAQMLRQNRIPKQKIKVFGFPLRNNRDSKICYEAFKRSLGLSHGKKLFLAVFSTGVNILRTRLFLKKLDKIENLDFELLIITGRNEKLKKTLEKIKWNHDTKILGWVSPMTPYLEIADIVFTKAGGATVMECIDAHKPMIIIKVIPGQEESNVIFIRKYGLGDAISWSMRNTEKVVRKIIDNYPEVIQNLKKIAIPNASRRIAKFLIAKILESEYRSTKHETN